MLVIAPGWTGPRREMRPNGELEASLALRFRECQAPRVDTRARLGCQASEPIGSFCPTSHIRPDRPSELLAAPELRVASRRCTSPLTFELTDR